MPDLPIASLTYTSTLDGTEDVPLQKSAVNRKTTITDIGAFVGLAGQWVDAGPITFSATGAAPVKGTTSADRVRWRRVGDTAEIRYNYKQTGAGTAGTPTTRLHLPSGLIADLAKVSLSAALDGSTADTFPVSTVGAGWIGISGSSGVVHASLVANDRFDMTALWAGGGAVAHYPFGPVTGFNLTLADLTFSITIVVPILGWTASVATLTNRSFRLAEKYPMARVTTTPANLGEYRSRIRPASGVHSAGSDSAPTAVPSSADGFKLYGGESWGAAEPAGSPGYYELFVGKNKHVTPQFYRLVGRTGVVLFEPREQASVTYGTAVSYDPTTGVVTVVKILSGNASTAQYPGLDKDFAGLSDIYFDLHVSDTPQAVEYPGTLAGPILQTRSVLQASSFNTSSASYVATGLIATLANPLRSLGNKVRVTLLLTLQVSASSTPGVTIFRNGVNIAPVPAAGFAPLSVTVSEVGTVTFSFDDTPGVLSPSYEVHIKSQTGTVTVDPAAYTSSLVLEELDVTASPVTTVQNRSYRLAETLTLTRVTVQPTALGEYRSYRKDAAATTGTDGAPLALPSVTDGFRIIAEVFAGAASDATRYEIFVGMGKSVDLEWYSAVGRTGYVSPDLLSPNLTVYDGAFISYNPTTGILLVDTQSQDSTTTTRGVGFTVPTAGGAWSRVTTAYFDIKISDTPQAVESTGAASIAETLAEGGGSKFVSPDRMKYHRGVAKVWINFNGTGTPAIRDSVNVASITDNGAGDYTINFTRAMANANYCVVTGGGLRESNIQTVAADSVRINIRGSTGTLTDNAIATLAIFGDLS